LGKTYKAKTGTIEKEKKKVIREGGGCRIGKWKREMKELWQQHPRIDLWGGMGRAN